MLDDMNYVQNGEHASKSASLRVPERCGDDGYKHGGKHTGCMDRKRDLQFIIMHSRPFLISSSVSNTMTRKETGKRSYALFEARNWRIETSAASWVSWPWTRGRCDRARLRPVFLRWIAGCVVERVGLCAAGIANSGYRSQCRAATACADTGRLLSSCPHPTHLHLPPPFTAACLYTFLL